MNENKTKILMKACDIIRNDILDLDGKYYRAFNILKDNLDINVSRDILTNKYYLIVEAKINDYHVKLCHMAILIDEKSYNILSELLEEK